ncbi:DUF7000 family protein [Methanocella sp. MCL-LM]|uniref:DUF7000 family protein n=1 Tax=Methanocella sp. MCL-LM TaxID=3412035 RepID=UPI003C792515
MPAVERASPFKEYMQEYKRQMGKGDIREAYRGLMEYIMALRSHFAEKYPAYSVPGNIYYGYMDMTYFSIVPESFKSSKLKVAIVFLHDTCRFEVWLAGSNRQVQAQYWKLFKESGWKKYRIPAMGKGVDSIVEHTLAENPDFGDLESLTRQIEAKTLRFIGDIEEFLSKH